MGLRIGKLDRRITLKRATTLNDQFNNPVQTWVRIARVWASREEIGDSERLRSREMGAEITTRFQIHYSREVADLNPKDRIVYNDKIFDIETVKEIGRREGLEITARARAD